MFNTFVEYFILQALNMINDFFNPGIAMIQRSIGEVRTALPPSTRRRRPATARLSRPSLPLLPYLLRQPSGKRQIPPLPPPPQRPPAGLSNKLPRANGLNGAKGSGELKRATELPEATATVMATTPAINSRSNSNYLNSGVWKLRRLRNGKSGFQIYT